MGWEQEFWYCRCGEGGWGIESMGGWSWDGSRIFGVAGVNVCVGGDVCDSTVPRAIGGV